MILIPLLFILIGLAFIFVATQLVIPVCFRLPVLSLFRSLSNPLFFEIEIVNRMSQECEMIKLAQAAKEKLEEKNKKLISDNVKVIK